MVPEPPGAHHILMGAHAEACSEALHLRMPGPVHPGYSLPAHLGVDPVAVLSRGDPPGALVGVTPLTEGTSHGDELGHADADKIGPRQQDEHGFEAIFDSPLGYHRDPLPQPRLPEGDVRDVGEIHDVEAPVFQVHHVGGARRAVRPLDRHVVEPGSCEGNDDLGKIPGRPVDVCPDYLLVPEKRAERFNPHGELFYRILQVLRVR